MAAAAIAGSGYALTGLDGDPARGELEPPPEPTQTAGPSLPPAPPPPTPPYTCIYKVVDGEAVCEPLRGRDPYEEELFEACPPIQFQGRAACLPPGASLHSVIGEGVPGTVGDPLHPKDYTYIKQGSSIVKWADKLLEYTVLPQDEPDFRALRELFLPGGAAPPPPPYPYNCRYVVVGEAAECLPLDSALMEGCVPISFQDRSACLPPGIEGDIEYTVSDNPTTYTYTSSVIRRGNSVIKYYDEPVTDTLDTLLEYTVAPEDEADFRGLKELFLPGQ